MPSRRLQIFISSPSDVLPERVLAERVIERLGHEFAAQVELEAVRWEREPMLATRHFQDNIVRPSATDIVVVILWSRLGVNLPPDTFPGPLTAGTVTGTEWEFEEAALASRQTGKPDILVFRKTRSLSVPVDDDVEEETARAGSARVKQFVRRWFTDEETGTYRNAYRTFSEPDHLESMLHDHLRALIQARVDMGAASAGRRIVWARGSPFRGLQSFEVSDGLVFHGRTRARHELREALLAQQARGCPLVVVVGASGSGKSSLVKAGLINDLRVPGLLEGVGLCRYAIMRPGDARSGLCGELSQALLEPDALPELGDLEQTAASLAVALEQAPAQAVPSIKLALRKAAEQSRLAAHASALLVVVVDQLEEIFTAARSADHGPFVAALETLARSGLVWIVATLRSDFLPRLETIPRLAELTAGGHYLLSAPRESEVGLMIRLPAEAAGLSFEIDPRTGVSLDEEVRKAAGSHAGSLPLLEYFLDRLWHLRTPDGTLTFAAYEALGGVENTLATRAEEAFQALPEEARDAFPAVLRALATVLPGEQARVTARPAALEDFPEGTPARLLIDAFQSPDARLLVVESDRRVRVAHEALLTHWQRARDQLRADRRDLEARAVLEQEAARWAASASADRDTLLLPPGIRLAQAQDLVERRAAGLGAAVIEYVGRSIAADRSRVARLEWQRLDAEAAKLRAMVEDRDARAHRNDALAARLEAQGERPDKAEYLASLRRHAQEFRAQAEALWKDASALDDRLRDHPGAPTHAEARTLAGPAVFTLEMLDAKGGECFIVHYGSPGAIRLGLVDGGPRPVFKERLAPRLARLRDSLSPGGALPLELVMVSHADEDRLRGIVDLLQSIEAARAPGKTDGCQIGRIWYNHFLALEDGGSAKRSERVLRRGHVPFLARTLGIPLNTPFDYYVMPAESGPARVALPGGLSVTVLGPPARRVAEWHRHWQREAGRVQESLPLSLADQLGGAFSDGFSSPDVTLLRARAYSASPGGGAPPEDHHASGAASDRSPTNLASIVAMFEIHGRTMLLTGDASGSDIIDGLEDAGYLGSAGPAHIDLLKLPHWGSTRNLTEGFFRRIVAEHYVIAGNSRFGLPAPELLETIAASRGTDEFHVHVSLGDQDDEPRARLQAAFDRVRAKGGRGELHFRQPGATSHLIDLADRVTY